MTVIPAEQGMGGTGQQHMLLQGVTSRPSHCGLAKTPTSLNSLALCLSSYRRWVILRPHW